MESMFTLKEFSQHHSAFCVSRCKVDPNISSYGEDGKRTTLLPRDQTEITFSREVQTIDAIGRVFFAWVFAVTRITPLGLRLVLAALRKAMSILGEAVVLLAIPAAGGYEARKMLLLTGL